MSKGTIVVGGYGPGISASVARKFGREGFDVALVGRSAERVIAGAAELAKEGIKAKAFPADLGDERAVRALVREVRSSLGPLAVVHWNAYRSSAGDLITASADELRSVLELGVHSLVAGVQEALPDLRASKGAVLVTGGGLSAYSPQVDAMAVAWGAMGLAVAKAAQHKLVGVLHERLKKEGVYVGEVVVLGLVKGTAFDQGNATLDPAEIAARFWDLAQKRAEASVTFG
jgi:short-subunit dehydrogenase